MEYNLNQFNNDKTNIFSTILIFIDTKPSGRWISVLGGWLSPKTPVASG